MSWVITCITSGRAWEVFDKKDADQARECGAVLVEPIRDYLERIAEEAKEEGSE